MDGISLFKIFVVSFVIMNSKIRANQSLDAREGEDFILKCRFDKQYRSLNEFSYFWTRLKQNPLKFDNVAINENLYDSSYKLNFSPQYGVYDLEIKNSSYLRDNAKFECRIKAIGSGRDIHHEEFNLTVLVVPAKPTVEPGLIASGTEGEKLELKCSTVGGSPTPQIIWYRDDEEINVPSTNHKNGSENIFWTTTSAITIVPKREDDGAKYQCLVWNRALEKKQQLEAAIVLNINYFPRITIGPANPLKVERDSIAKLECRIDAKPKVNRIRWSRNGRLISSLLTHTIQRVSIQDAGKYTCSAENGLGKTGENDLILDVLYAPMVNLETKVKEVEERANITVNCTAISNPKPKTIEWVKDGNLAFHQNGEILELNNIQASDAGTYICRALNFLETSDGRQFERIGNSSTTVLVRHRPGEAYITPDKPIVHVGNGITLSCGCKNPGWPLPKYRWFRDILEGEEKYTSSTKILAEGTQYVIIRAHLGTEGKYHCVAANELGAGEIASVQLEVHQSPQLLSKLPEFQTRRKGDANFGLSCSAKGKPKPSVRWLKDDQDLSPKFYEIRTNTVEGPNSMYTIQSNLRFLGIDRTNTNQLTIQDRGHYTCFYENEVDNVNSTMLLRIEHGPMVEHQYNKVAYDIREKGDILCRVRAYPRPEFQWFYGNNSPYALPTSNEHYQIHSSSSSSENPDNIFTSILTINGLQHSDYGEYICQVTNSMNSIRTPIRLQQKGPPEKPTNLKAKNIGSNFVQLEWEAGFDGGLSNTKFFASYRRVVVPPKNNEEIIRDCATIATSNTDWMEFDCQRSNPCGIIDLDSHQTYIFKVRAMNSKGHSVDYSNEIHIRTKVAKVSKPLYVSFDIETKIIRINVGASCLPISAVVENLVNHGHTKRWEIIDSIALQVAGNGPTFKEVILHHFGIENIIKKFDNFEMEIDMSLTIRVKLCLNEDLENCSDYFDAEIINSKLNKAFSTSSLIALTVSAIIFGLFASLILMFCRFKRQRLNKSQEDYEMSEVVGNSTHRQSSTSQPPPPYYTSQIGLDNQALEHTGDLNIDFLDSAELIYDRHGEFHSNLQQTGSASASLNRKRMSSVSQDSVWQVKMSAKAAGQYSTLRKSRNFTDLTDYECYNPATNYNNGQPDEGLTYNYENQFPTNTHDQIDFGSSYAAVSKPNIQPNLDYAELCNQNANNCFPDDYMRMDGYQIYENNQNFQITSNINNHNSDDFIQIGESQNTNRGRRVIREIVV